MVQSTLVFSLFFLLAFVFASLVEYWLHRLMHLNPRIGKRHLDHHRRNEGQGFLWEFRDYVCGGALGMFPVFFYAWDAGWGWCLGALSFCLFSAYAHQMQHDNPMKCFWMAMPVHYVHHKYGMWHHNFGLAVDWWDRIFGTYKPVDWIDAGELAREPRSHLALKWW